MSLHLLFVVAVSRLVLRVRDGAARQGEAVLRWSLKCDMARKQASYDPEMVEAARQLWLKYGGRQLARIESEMRAAGWKFHKNRFYTRQIRSRTIVGWPERFGWREELRSGVTEHDSESKGRRNAGRHDFEHWLIERHSSAAMTWTYRYQRYLYKRLADVTSGKTKRLMVFLPPRHGKSELVTIRYVAWRLLRDPRLNVILGSYNQRLANRFSKRIQRIVETREAESEVWNEEEGTTKEPENTQNDRGRQGCLPVRSALQTKRLRGVAEWETVGGGVVRAVGVGGGIAGFGAGLVVIDDPVRNRADAESANKRETVDDWFRSDIYTRLEPDAAIILIQTRWHEDDLAGRLLREMKDGGEPWEVVCLPAIAEENSGGQLKDAIGRRAGEALCPQRYDVKALERIRRKLGTYAFSALYQQRPKPREGGQFKRSWFTKIVDHMPAGLDWKRGYDLAVSTKQSADHTASFRVAMDRNGYLYIADGFRAKIEYPEQRRFIIEKMKTEERTEHGIEAALHGKAVVQELRREPELRRFALREVRVTADKLTRALAWLNLAEAGKVVLVRGPWIEEFVDEVAAFPTGRHDDQIDAVSTAVIMISLRRGAQAAGF